MSPILSFRRRPEFREVLKNPPPANAWINVLNCMDSRFRGNDEE